MRRRAKTLGIALTGAAALASGGYALGSQSGGGLATAQSSRSGDASDPGRGRFGPRCDGARLESLAKKLGVTTARLRTAFDDLRPEKPAGDPRDRFAGELANALDLPVAKVTAALEKLRPDRGRGGPPGRPPGGPPRPGPGGPPGGPMGGPPGRGPGDGAFAAALAKELDVEAADVRAALDRLGTAKRDAFAAALAKRLDLPAEKVREALTQRP